MEMCLGIFKASPLYESVELQTVQAGEISCSLDQHFQMSETEETVSAVKQYFNIMHSSYPCYYIKINVK